MYRCASKEQVCMYRCASKEQVCMYPVPLKNRSAFVVFDHIASCVCPLSIVLSCTCVLGSCNPSVVLGVCLFVIFFTALWLGFFSKLSCHSAMFVLKQTDRSSCLTLLVLYLVLVSCRPTARSGGNTLVSYK